MFNCDLLINNAHILTMNAARTVYPKGALAINGSRIVAVGAEREIAPLFKAARTISANGAPVHPGFVESHVHLMHTIRGVFPDVIRNYSEGMERYTRWWDALEDDDEYASSLLSCLEILKSGATCFVEVGTVFEPDTAARAAEAIGIRAVLADPFLWDCPNLPPVRRAPVSLDRCLRIMGGQLWRNAQSDALVRGHVSLYGVATASDELERAAKQCADRNQVVFAQHQSFSQTDVAQDDARFGKHAIVHFERLGVLGPNSLLVHMNHIRPDEINPLIEHGVSIAWCPEASMMSGVGGTFRGQHAELFRKGVNISLGSDSATLGCGFDVSLQGLLAVLTTREKIQDRQALYAENALEMATVNGAKAIGMYQEIGSLEPGKRADLVIRRTDLPEAQPGANVPQNLIFVAGSKSVDTVIVNGEVVMQRGHSTRIDEGWVYSEARRSTGRMMKRLGICAEPRWPHVD